jgi:hypothetical protein
VTFRVAEKAQDVYRYGLVHAETQLLQILAEYNSLGDWRKLTIPEIAFFYEPLIKGLMKQQKQEMEDENK